MSERNSFWLKLAAILVPLIAAALIGWGSLKSDVATQGREIDRKADAGTVDVEYQSLLRELQEINSRLDDIQKRLR